MTTPQNREAVNVYKFLRLRVGSDPSDRELARRWGMPWRSFVLLKSGRRHPPRVAELARLAKLLHVPPACVFEVARGIPARRVHKLIEGDKASLAKFLVNGS